MGYSDLQYDLHSCVSPCANSRQSSEGEPKPALSISSDIYRWLSKDFWAVVFSGEKKMVEKEGQINEFVMIKGKNGLKEVGR